MDWTMEEGYGIPIGTHYHMSYPQEVSLVSFPLHLSPFTRKQLYRRLQQAYASGALRLVKRIHALLALAEGLSGLSQKFLDHEEAFGILSSVRRKGVCLRSVQKSD